MSDVNLNAYFERVGFAGSIAPNLTTLEALHSLHPAAIPFENLDPLLAARYCSTRKASSRSCSPTGAA